MIRAQIKSGVARVLSGIGPGKISGLLWGYRNLPVVIGYHRVVEDFESAAKTSIPAQLVSLQMLERHLEWIGRRFRFVTLDEAGALIQSGDRLDRPAAAITFDDGYRDFYDLAFPLLQKKGIPAAVFVVTDLVGTTRAQSHDKLYLLLGRRRKSGPLVDRAAPDISGMGPYQATRALIETLSFSAIQKIIASLEAEDSISDEVFKPFHSMTWEMLQETRRAGHTIGSHTKSHVLLTGENGHRLRQETLESRLEIEGRLGIPIRHFAYPSSRFNASAVSAVANAGYRYAYTGCMHRSKQHPLLTIPRTILWERSSVDADRFFSPSILDCQIHHAFDIVGGCRRRDHTAKEHHYGRL